MQLAYYRKELMQLAYYSISMAEGFGMHPDMESIPHKKVQLSGTILIITDHHPVDTRI